MTADSLQTMNRILLPTGTRTGCELSRLSAGRGGSSAGSKKNPGQAWFAVINTDTHSQPASS